mmetsp:Transcript_12187/g.34550  ORF Transcript_12187/g.34550 Transcript_12187/m.34550 type:complete len:217 (-) Transcript_12187:46-696(-)
MARLLDRLPTCGLWLPRGLLEGAGGRQSFVGVFYALGYAGVWGLVLNSVPWLGLTFVVLGALGPPPACLCGAAGAGTWAALCGFALPLARRSRRASAGSGASCGGSRWAVMERGLCHAILLWYFLLLVFSGSSCLVFTWYTLLATGTCGCPPQSLLVFSLSWCHAWQLSTLYSQALSSAASFFCFSGCLIRIVLGALHGHRPHHAGLALLLPDRLG